MAFRPSGRLIYVDFVSRQISDGFIRALVTGEDDAEKIVYKNKLQAFPCVYSFIVCMHRCS